MFGVFLSVAAVLCLLPLLLLGVVQALAGLLWCVCSAFPGAPAVFPLSVMQLADLLGFHTWLSQVGCPTPAVTVSRGVGVVLVQMSCYPLCFFLVPAQLPLRGSAPFTGELACLTPVCWSPPGVGLEGTCCVLFLWACSVRCFPCYWFPWGFQVTGGLYCFPGDVGWASALPFLFWASPAPLPCWGSWSFAPCVRVLRLRFCLLGLQVRLPCCLSLTLEWVCF